MSRFKMNSKASKEAAKKATASGGIPNFKMEGQKAKILILGPTSDDKAALFTHRHHEIWVDKRPVSKYGAPSVKGEKDMVSDIGWKLRDKYKDNANEKKKDFWRKFLPKTSHCVNILDLNNLEKGPQVYQMGGTVSEVVLDEFNDVGEDLTSVCDFDEGRILEVKHNGKSGFNRRYKAKFLSEKANLIENGDLTEEEIEAIADKMFELENLQQKYTKEAEEKHLDMLVKAGNKIGIDIDDLAVVEEEDTDGDEFEEDDDKFDEDDIDMEESKSDDEEDEFEDDDFEEEKPKKAAKKAETKGRRGKRK